MPIYHFPGYLSKEQYADQHKIKVRTINDWIARRSPIPENFKYTKVDGYDCIKDIFDPTVPPTGIPLHDLEWARNFATRNGFNFPHVYEDIIAGRLSAVVLADRIFILKTDPQVLDYVAKYKRKRAVGIPFYIKYP